MDRSCRSHGGSLSSIDLAHPTVVEVGSRGHFPQAGTEVTCAVSGGADSLCLMVLAVAAGCKVTAVHVDHRLRPGSDQESGVVVAAGIALGAQVHCRSVPLDDGPNLEARARQARYGVLPVGVLTGHTADDRAETVLLHLMRGAGPTGAVGIARSAQRPLLDLRRADTEAVCRAVGLEPVTDPSNNDPRFARNRVRHEVLPLLADIAGRDPVPILVRQADLFADIDDDLKTRASAVDPTSAAQLAAAPRPVAGAAIRAWLVAQGVGEGYGVDSAAVARVLAVASGQHRATEVAGGWTVRRSAGRLSVTAPRAWQDADHGR